MVDMFKAVIDIDGTKVPKTIVEAIGIGTEKNI